MTTQDTAVTARKLEAFDDMLDALHTALPFVEDALDDPCYKAGAVKKVLEKIRAAIEEGNQP
jgi:hypothetical protein